MTRSFRKEIKEPDALHRGAGRIVELYSANQKTILLAVGAILIVILGFVGYQLWSAHVQRQAAISLASVDIIAGDPLSPERERVLRRTAENYPSTRSGVMARLRLGALLKERGDPAAAVIEYRALLNSASLTDTDRELAQRGLAGSLSLQGKCGEAIPVWKQILEKGSLLTPEDIYISLGNCYEATGNPAEALKTYETLVQKHPGSPFISPEIRDRMARLGGK